MARTFKAASIFALSLLFAPSFVSAMNNNNEEKITEKPDRLIREIEIYYGQKNGDKSHEEWLNTLKKNSLDQLEKEHEKAEKHYKSEKAKIEQEKQIAKTKAEQDNQDKFNSDLKKCYRFTKHLRTQGENGNAELSKKQAAIDLAVIAGILVATYYGTETGNYYFTKAGRLVVSPIVSEETKAKWALNDEIAELQRKENAAKKEEAKKAELAELAKLKATLEKRTAEIAVQN